MHAQTVIEIRHSFVLFRLLFVSFHFGGESAFNSCVLGFVRRWIQNSELQALESWTPAGFDL